MREEKKGGGVETEERDLEILGLHNVEYGLTLLCLCTCCQSVMEVVNGLIVEESAESR